MDVTEQQVAEFAMQFMQRAQLEGREVPAFNAAMELLDRIAHPQPEPEQAP